MVAVEVLVQGFFEGLDLVHWQIVHVALVDAIQRQRHFRDRHRGVLLLLHQLGDALAAFQLGAGGGVQIGSELGEGGQLTILRQCQSHTAAELLDGLGLGRAADAGHRDASVHGGANTGIEQIGFEEDLAVGDRDHVGRHEGRDVTGLGFDDRQCGQ